MSVKLILSFISEENLNVGTKRSSRKTGSPVLGFLAGLALRPLHTKVPKPRSSIVLFSISFSPTRLKNCSMTI
jgi:hypothetical protein